MRALALLTLFTSGVALGQDGVPTFTLIHGNERGNGFVVRDFRPGKTGMLLMSALHVVATASSITVARPDCTSTQPLKNVFTLKKGRAALVWPQLDTVAFELTEEEARQVGSQPATLDLSDQLPEVHKRVLLEGTSSTNSCQGGSGKINGVPRVGAHLETLQLYDPRTKDTGLDHDARLIQYGSDEAAPGLSGAPVVLRSARGRVIGIHIAGYETKSIGWAIALTNQATALNAPLSEEVGDWSRRTKDVHQQVAAFVSADARSHHVAAFGVEATAPWGFTRQFRGAIPGVGLLLHGQWEAASPESANALFFAASLGGWYQPARQTFLSPRDVVVGTSDVSQWGGAFEAFVGFRLFRLALVSPEIRLGGRVRLASWNDGAKDQLDATLAGVALLGVSFVPERLGFEVLLEGAIEPAPRTDARYTGDAASVVRLEAVTAFRFGLRAGMVFWP